MALLMALMVALLGLATIASAANPSIKEAGSVKDLIDKIHQNGKTECDFNKLLELVEALPQEGEDYSDFYELFNKKASDLEDGSDGAKGENSVFFAPTNQAIERFMLNVLKATPQDLSDAKSNADSKYLPLLKIVNKILQYHWLDHSEDIKNTLGDVLDALETMFENGFDTDKGLGELRESELATKSSSDDDYWPVTATSICDLDEDDDDIPPSTFEIKPNGGKNRITLHGNDFERSQGTVDFRDSKNLFHFILQEDTDDKTQRLSVLPIDGVIIPYSHINLKAYTKSCNWPVGKSFSLFERAINMVPDIKERIEAAWFRGLIVAPSDDAFLHAFDAVGIPSLSRNPDIFFSNPSLVKKVLEEHIIDNVNDGQDNRPGWPTSSCEDASFTLKTLAGTDVTVIFRGSSSPCRVQTVRMGENNAFTTEDQESFGIAGAAGLPMENAAEGRLIFSDRMLLSVALKQNGFEAYEDLSDLAKILTTAQEITGNTYRFFMGNTESLLDRIERTDWLDSDRYTGSSILAPSDAAIERLARMVRPDDAEAVQKFSEDASTQEQILPVFFIDTPITYPEEIYQTSDPDVEVKVTYGTEHEVASVTVQTNAFYKKHPVAIQMARVDGTFRSLDNRALYFIDSVPMIPETRDSVLSGSTGGSSSGSSDSQDGETAQLTSTQRRFQISLAPQSPSTSGALTTEGSAMYNSFTRTTREAILADSPTGTKVVLESMEAPNGVVTATYLITYPAGTSRSTAANNAANLAKSDLTSGLGFSAINVEQADITEGVASGAGATTVRLGLSLLLGLLALVFSM